MPKEMIAFRLPSDLVDWLTDYTRSTGTDRTKFVQELLENFREGRVTQRPRGPDAFPKGRVGAGETPEFPVLISL